MGTGYSQDYTTTIGSHPLISDEALRHALKGEFKESRSPSGEIEIMMLSGGHAEVNYEYLQQMGIKITDLKIFSNGVRMGNVENHYQKAKRLYRKQVWFPSNWTPRDIYNAGVYVASRPEHAHSSEGTRLEAMYKGVNVGVIMRHGKIATIFPSYDQPEV